MNYIEERIAAIQSEITTAQAAAHEETKSSAGDKYETGRAMMQQEIEKNTVQLAEAQKLKGALLSIQPGSAFEQVQAGSLVVTNHGTFYLSVPVGIVTIDNNNYMALSPASPIGAKMMRLKTGDTFVFNAKSYKIEQVL